MRKIISITIAVLFMSLGYIQVYAEEEKALVITYIHDKDCIKEISKKISIENAKGLAVNLEKLTVALKESNYVTARKILDDMTTDGVIPDSEIQKLIHSRCDDTHNCCFPKNSSTLDLTNLLSFVFGYGNDGAFAYPLDLLAIFGIVALFGWLPLGILLVFAYSYLWLVISHLLPFRLILPLIYIGLADGELTFLGTQGMTGIRPPENETVTALMFGFIGIVINIIFPPDENSEAMTPFFCLGYSLATFRVQKSL